LNPYAEMSLNLDWKGSWGKPGSDAMRDEPTASSTGQSTSSGDQNTPSSHRKERGAIAAQVSVTPQFPKSVKLRAVSTGPDVSHVDVG